MLRFVPTRLTFVVLALALLGFRCTRDTQSPETSSARARPRPDLRLFLLTDPKGYLEPCGCQQRPLGGVDKLATALSNAKRDGVPSLLLAVGDLTFGTKVHGDDAAHASAEERLRAEALIDVWNELGMAAATPGPLDFGVDPAVRKALTQRAKFAWLVANVDANALPGTTRERLLDVGGHKVGVFGVLGPSPSLGPGITPSADLALASKRATEALRSQGAKLVIALSSGDRRAAREVAQGGPDLVVMGGLDREEPLPPSTHHGAVLLHAGRQGQRVVRVDLALTGDGKLRDASSWSLDEQQKAEAKEIDELSKRIAEWEKDPKVNREDLARQKARLDAMKAERTKPSATSYEGRWLSAEAIELSPDVKGEPKIAARMDALDRRINEHNREALSHLEPKPVSDGEARYAGSESCKGCHEAAYTWWRNTKHGRAYATLENVHKQFSLACVGCHVTGYNEPGGSTVTHVGSLKDVGCESCHAPGSKHNLEPEVAGLVRRNTPEPVCISCHNPEHSARFDYAAFRSLLIVPGHGLPSPSDGQGKK